MNAVQTARKSDRIHKTADGKIDIDVANKEWFMNTDPAKSRKTDPLFDAQSSLANSSKQNFSTFQQAKTADVYYRAMLVKAKLKMITGETIDRKKAGQHAFNLCRSPRDLFIWFPTRYGSLIAAELAVDEHKTVTVYEYVRKLLEESRNIIEREL